MRDPFLITGPALVSFSGGLTSGLMLRRILDAHGGSLPRDVHVVFSNTGRERPETLDFVAEVERRWCPITWLERDASSREGYREVSFETACRDGGPFAELIEERSFLPNGAMKFCTTELKIRVMRAFMLARGHEAWTNVVGLRRDEPARVAKHHARNARGENEWTTVVPLYDAKIYKRDVAAFWATQDFRLSLRSWEGNCDACFMKGRRVRERIFRDRPDLAAWWVSMEDRIGGTFIHGERYASTLARVRRLPLLPLDLEPEVERDESIDCACTDRRVARRPSCSCGGGRGRGHALACVRVFGRGAR